MKSLFDLVSYRSINYSDSIGLVADADNYPIACFSISEKIINNKILKRIYDVILPDSNELENFLFDVVDLVYDEGEFYKYKNVDIILQLNLPNTFDIPEDIRVISGFTQIDPSPRDELKTYYQCIHI